MRKTFKGLLSFLLVITLILSLASCAKKEPEIKDTVKESITAEETGVKDAVEESIATEEAEDTEKKNITIVDLTGREVELELPLERVIISHWESLEAYSAPVGEKIFDSVVGIGESGGMERYQNAYTKHFPHLSELPSIGMVGSYDLEKILSLEPDAFLINFGEGFIERFPEVVSTLDEAGIPMVFLPLSDDPFTSPQKAAKILGEIYQTNERADEFINYLDNKFALIEERVPEDGEKPKVYHEAGSGSRDEYSMSFTNSGWGLIMAFAGGDNISVNNVNDKGRIDPEYLLESDPDFIFITSGMGYGPAEASMESINNSVGEYVLRTGWDRLKAVQNNDVYSYYHNHQRSPLVFYYTMDMAKMFYPEEFSDIDPEAELKEFFDTFLYTDYEDGFWKYKLGEKLE
ncbi:MAG: ABC transporter substrate-binding protein [Tissierellia bacterium]|nr:ABC transporter substrate-binding protein [Bacillota bacterium]NLL22430.1 ABC transporter substrate-binding protein [Tissierellia bacterium]